MPIYADELRGPTPDEVREAKRAAYQAAVTRLGDELDKMARMITFAREALENELFSGMGYKQMGIASADVQKISTLSTALERAVSAKIRYDKAAKDMADSMTPEEELKSVRAYLRSLDQETLREVRDGLNDLILARNKASLLSRNVGPEPG